MKIKQGMILAAGLGKRMLPITLKTPKPLIKIGSQNLLERSIKLLINHGVEEIAINVHHLSNQIKDFIDNQRYKAKIIISDEKELLLNTGGGILAATKSFKNSFITINPDTLWNESYAGELQNLEDFYFKKNNPCLLLVDKNLSFDTSFKGDFNLNQDVISRDKNNKFKAGMLLNMYPDNDKVKKIINMESNELSEDSARVTINTIIGQLERKSNEIEYFELLNRYSQGGKLSDIEREFIKNFKK